MVNCSKLSHRNLINNPIFSNRICNLEMGEEFTISRILLFLVVLLLGLQLFEVDTRLNIDHRVSVILTLVVFLLAIFLRKGKAKG